MQSKNHPRSLPAFSSTLDLDIIPPPILAKELALEYDIGKFMSTLLDTPSSKNAPATAEVTEFVTEVTIVEKSVEVEVHAKKTETVQATTEKMEELTVADVVVMKRRIEELEDQASRDKKKLRGLVAVAVGAAGIAAASVIPQVLPYFS